MKGLRKKNSITEKRNRSQAFNLHGTGLFVVRKEVDGELRITLDLTGSTWMRLGQGLSPTQKTEYEEIDTAHSIFPLVPGPP